MDADAEFELLGADEDNLGITLVRLQQVYKDVPVFGSHLIVRVKDNKAEGVVGRILKEARQVNPKPSLSAAQATEAAKAALGYKGKFAVEPESVLVILPHQVKDSAAAPGATLVYRVELLI